ARTPGTSRTRSFVLAVLVVLWVPVRVFPLRHEIRARPDLQPRPGLEAAAEESERARAAEDGQDDPAVEALAAGIGRDHRLDLGDLGPVLLLRIETGAQLDVGAVEVDRPLARRMPEGNHEADLVEV